MYLEYRGAINKWPHPLAAYYLKKTKQININTNIYVIYIQIVISVEQVARKINKPDHGLIQEASEKASLME